MLFEDNVLTKEKKTSQKVKIEALIKASVKNNINISKRKGNLRHPSCRRMTILLFHYKAGLGVEHGITFVYISKITEGMNKNLKQKA